MTQNDSGYFVQMVTTRFECGLNILNRTLKSDPKIENLVFTPKILNKSNFFFQMTHNDSRLLRADWCS